MKFFDQYTSNTLAGSGNQHFFVNAKPDHIQRSRICYKVFCGGDCEYSFLFSNIMDSTFADGSVSHKNLVLDTWTIHEMRVGVTDFCDENTFAEPRAMQAVTFDGKAEKEVNPGEFFSTDGIRLSPASGQYICLEIAFSGGVIPYHEETIIPSFVYRDGAWVPDKLHPFAAMVGCDRPVKKRIGFLGDSITQGIGTEVNAYDHWNCVVAENIGADYAYWNLGLGYGRAGDMASGGAWMFKALQNDLAVVCYGVNDILQGFSEASIKQDLNTIVDTLKHAGKQVILQTIPPFDYQGEKIDLWKRLNTYIKAELSAKVDAVFDCAVLLGESPEAPHLAPYGGHPNAAGCRIWGDQLTACLKALLRV